MNLHDRIEQMRNARRKHRTPEYLPGERDDRLPMCPFCGQSFASVEDLIEHQDDEGHVIEII
jgi:hypothetical protein